MIDGHNTINIFAPIFRINKRVMFQIIRVLFYKSYMHDIMMFLYTDFFLSNINKCATLSIMQV